MTESLTYSHIDTVALRDFHSCGIKLNGLDVFGMTPLHEAVLYARVDDVVSLLKLGFDPTVPDIRGVSALDLAQGILDDRKRSAILNALNSRL